MTTLSTDEIEKLSHNIVYQVAYSFYDRPYILLFKLLITFNVYISPHFPVRGLAECRCQEQELADTLGINRNDLRKYLGRLKDLVKSYVGVLELVLIVHWPTGK
jgi:transcription initiation factor TFIIE subunit alpha